LLPGGGSGPPARSFQEYNLLGSLNALENVLLPLRNEQTMDVAGGVERAMADN
jgi:ABC-type lipoprotein export system ATPase subunit